MISQTTSELQLRPSAPQTRQVDHHVFQAQDIRPYLSGKALDQAFLRDFQAMKRHAWFKWQIVHWSSETQCLCDWPVKQMLDSPDIHLVCIRSLALVVWETYVNFHRLHIKEKKHHTDHSN
jgi:hypothetical protein